MAVLNINQRGERVYKHGEDKGVSIILPIYIPDQEADDISSAFFESLWKTIGFWHGDTSTRPRPIQTICIDNGSGAYRTVENAFDMYVYKPKPIGYARAVNIGLALADYRYVMVLNNDLILRHGWVEKMIEVYERDDKRNYGILSAMNWGSERKEIYDDAWYSLWMSDKETLAEIGYLSESLAYRYHDQDHAIRAYRKGYKVQRTGEVIVNHKEATTFNKMTEIVGNQFDPQSKTGKEYAEMINRFGVPTYREWRDLIGTPLGSPRTDTGWIHD